MITAPIGPVGVVTQTNGNGGIVPPWLQGGDFILPVPGPNDPTLPVEPGDFKILPWPNI